MTKQMGKLIGNHLGTYVLFDKSRKEEQFGSILRIRVCINVLKLLRRYVTVQIEDTKVQVDVCYEKLPLTCFMCGMMNHIEGQCSKYHGKVDDDKAKPYGRWFQNDVLTSDYRRSTGRRFGYGLGDECSSNGGRRWPWGR